MGKKSGFWLLLILAIISLSAASCNAATPSPRPVPPSPTFVPTNSPQPTDSSPVNRGPTVKNYSLVTGSIVKVVPESSDPAFIRLTLNVASTSHVESYPSFTDDKIGQEIEILMVSTLAGTITAGNSVQIKVTYRGDERGSVFFGSDLTILP